MPRPSWDASWSVPSRSSVLDVPTVAVSDPGAGGGDQAPVVAGGDDLVADSDGLVADLDAVGVDVAGGDAGDSGAQGELVDGVVIGGHDDHRAALVSGVEPGLVGGVERLVASPEAIRSRAVYSSITRRVAPA